MPFVFQPNQSRGLDAIFHFPFTGAEQREATITIKNRTIDIQDGLIGKADLRVTADAKTWLGFLAGEKSLPLALITTKDPHQGKPAAAARFRQMLSVRAARGTSRSRSCPQPSLFRARAVALPEERSGDRKDQVAGQARACEKEDVTHNVKTLRFKTPDGANIPFDYRPGQFLTLHIAPDGVPTKRSYTIASTPTWRDRIEITVKREDQGLVSRWLHDELEPGDEVEIEAPNGTFHFTGEGRRERAADRRWRRHHAHDERGALSHRHWLARHGASGPRLPDAWRFHFPRRDRRLAGAQSPIFASPSP